jgi:hypothetical protein
LRNLLDQLLQSAVVADGLANAIVPIPGNTELAELTLLALHQVEGMMELPGNAMAGGFAALAAPFGEGAAEKPVAGGELSNAGAEVPLRGGELRAAKGVGHVLYHYYIQDPEANASPKNNANLPIAYGYAKTYLDSNVSVLNEEVVAESL